MTLKKLNSNKSFLIKWLIANFLAIPVGFILAVILSEAIVNIFHPEETNLIVGLCFGTSVGFAQWLVLKKSLNLPKWWIGAPALGIGIPFALMVLLKEGGFTFPNIFNIEGIFEKILYFFVGCLAGVLQFKMLKVHFTNPIVWVLASGIAWGISFSINGLWIPGLVMGLITAITIVWILKPINVQM